MASASSAVDIGFVPQGHHSKEKAEEWATKREPHTHTQNKEHIVFGFIKMYKSHSSGTARKKKETDGEQYENIKVSCF